jgi:hypothetical protein
MRSARGLGLLIAASCWASATVGAPTPAPAAARVLLRAETSGGFVPAFRAAADVPELTVYADGLTLVSGPITRRGATVPTIRALRLGAVWRHRLSILARRSRLFAVPAPSLDATGVADFATTAVTFSRRSGGGARVHAYALDFTGNDAALPPATLVARARLRALLAYPEAHARPAGTWQPTTWCITALPTPERQGLTRWPGPDLARDPADAATTLVAGATGRRARDLIAGEPGAAWQVGDAAFVLAIRPLLPDQHRCA